jgi:hypothetical protein
MAAMQDGKYTPDQISGNANAAGGVDITHSAGWLNQIQTVEKNGNQITITPIDGPAFSMSTPDQTQPAGQ